MKETPDCSIQRLVTIVERLRGPDGCPWDKVQTTNSLRPYLLEECHEFLGAIKQENSKEIRDELGDLLLQIVLHARIFEEQGLFNLNDAAESICNKLVRRHPHVFARQVEHETVDLELQWETIKQNEKIAAGKGPSLFEQIDSDLPPLLTARKIAEKAARIGLDWPDANSVIEKIREELDELEVAIQNNQEDEISHELGDLLFAVVSLARHLNVDSDVSLRLNLARFTKRVQHMESALHRRGQTFQDVTISELDRLWEQAKKNELSEKRA